VTTNQRRPQVTDTSPAPSARDVAAEQEPDIEVRRARALAAAGRFTGKYQPGYLDEIRDGWPQ